MSGDSGKCDICGGRFLACECIRCAYPSGTGASSRSETIGEATLHLGDCREVLAELAADSIDAIVTDPPYEIGFMGRSWDSTGIAYRPEVWTACLRVLKPGGHMLAFGGSRTYHRMACAIEDAGFEIRDQIMWLYGSGFPKSLDVSKAIDKAAGAEREVIGQKHVSNAAQGEGLGHGDLVSGTVRAGLIDVTAPATESARAWNGWGTALKPAHEPIVVARKPMAGRNTAANVVELGTGALNVDACRIATDNGLRGGRYPVAGRDYEDGAVYGSGMNRPSAAPFEQPLGRWPANVIHDGSPEVLEGFPERETHSPLGPRPAAVGTVFAPGAYVQNGKNAVYGKDKGGGFHPGFADGGSAARFFYCAKATREDREEWLEVENLKRGGPEQFDSRYKDGTGELRQTGSRQHSPDGQTDRAHALPLSARHAARRPRARPIRRERLNRQGVRPRGLPVHRRGARPGLLRARARPHDSTPAEALRMNRFAALQGSSRSNARYNKKRKKDAAKAKAMARARARTP